MLISTEPAEVEACAGGLQVRLTTSCASGLFLVLGPDAISLPHMTQGQAWRFTGDQDVSLTESIGHDLRFAGMAHARRSQTGTGREPHGRPARTAGSSMRQYASLCATSEAARSQRPPMTPFRYHMHRAALSHAPYCGCWPCKARCRVRSLRASCCKSEGTGQANSTNACCRQRQSCQGVARRAS